MGTGRLQCPPVPCMSLFLASSGRGLCQHQAVMSVCVTQSQEHGSTRSFYSLPTAMPTAASSAPSYSREKHTMPCVRGTRAKAKGWLRARAHYTWCPYIKKMPGLTWVRGTRAKAKCWLRAIAHINPGVNISENAGLDMGLQELVAGSTCLTPQQPKPSTNQQAAQQELEKPPMSPGQGCWCLYAAASPPDNLHVGLVHFLGRESAKSTSTQVA